MSNAPGTMEALQPECADCLTDFHTHLLPGMDDGSSSVEESLRMLHMSAKQGVRCIVLTPHFYADRDTPAHFLTKRARALDTLKQYVKPSDPLLIPGAEVKYFSGITAMDDLTALCVGSTRLLLLEMPFQKWSSQVLADVLELNSRKDLTIVIAHVERYMDLQPKGTLEHLVNNRILIQSNAEYFIHFLSRRKALQMLANGWIHLLGSDCHNTDSRPPCMGECIRIIRKKLGDETAKRLQTDALKLLLNSQRAASAAR